MKLVVVIPTYNERENIVPLLDALHQVFHTIRGYEISYLVVDDMSPDGTEDAVRAYAKKQRDVSVIVGKKEGLGKALLRGMTEAFEHIGADAVLQMDADLSHDPSVAPKLLDALTKGATFAVGSRYIPGGGIPENWGWIRKVYSIAGNTIVRFGLGHPGVRDWTGGYRAYKKEYYVRLHSEMEAYGGYVFQIAFLHKAIHMGAIIKEIPFHFTDRKYGHSKIAPAEYIFNIYKYMFTARLQEFFSGSVSKFLVVGGIGFLINAFVLMLLHDRMRMDATMANLIGAALAILSNFTFNNIWTFQENKISGVAMYGKKLLQFFATSAFGVIVIQTGTIWFGVRMFGESTYFTSFLIGTGLLVLWNYTVYSKVIWKKA